MRKLSTVAMFTTLLSMNAFAGDQTINIQGRTGWKYADNDVKKTQVLSSSSFSVDFLRTTFAGVVTPSVNYYLQTNLLPASTTADVTDATSDLIFEAYITKTFSFGSALTVGKRAVLVGGRESDYAEYDNYTNSAFYDAAPAEQVGATLSHEIAGQTVMAQLMNGNKDDGKDDGATTDAKSVNAQSKLGYALAWYGDISNGMIKPIVAYTVIPQGKSRGTSEDDRKFKGNDTYMSAGLQFNLPAGLTVEADYDLLTLKNATRTAADATIKADKKITSMVALVKFDVGTCAPFARFVSDTKKSNSVKTYTRTAYDLGVEFKEAKNDMIGYEIVYSSSTVKSDMNTTEVKSSPSSILVGLKFDAAVLK